DFIPYLFGKNGKVDERQRALFRAVVKDNVQGAAAAVPTHVDIGKQFPNGSSSLILATMFGRASMVDWLLDHGADLNMPDADGLAPLHVAVIAITREPQRKISIM